MNNNMTVQAYDLPSTEQLTTELHRVRYRRRYKRTIRSTIYTLITVAAIAILVATLWLPVLQIYGASMEPTLTEGDIVVSLKGGKFEPGEIVAFYYNNKILVKRVIGNPGDWIDIDRNGTVYVNNHEFVEPYLVDKALGTCDIELRCRVHHGLCTDTACHHHVAGRLLRYGGHSHGEECTKQVLVCTLTEEPDHIHTPECWGSRPVLLCTDESAEHEHTEECWSTVKEQICNPHVHDEHCYKQELICTLPEHVHTDACYEMPEETVPQDESFWQQLVPTLTKNWASDFMSAVRSQVGYTVSVIDKDENGNASSVYGAHYGTPYSNWDAAFLSWCLDRAAVPQYAGENVTVTVPQSSDTLNGSTH